MKPSEMTAKQLEDEAFVWLDRAHKSSGLSADTARRTASLQAAAYFAAIPYTRSSVRYRETLGERVDQHAAEHGEVCGCAYCMSAPEYGGRRRP